MSLAVLSLITMSSSVMAQNSLNDEYFDNTYEDCVKFSEKFDNTCSLENIRLKQYSRLLFDEVPEKEMDCKNLGKCPFTTWGVSANDILNKGVTSECKFKRKLCVTCYKVTNPKKKATVKKI